MSTHRPLTSFWFAARRRCCIATLGLVLGVACSAPDETPDPDSKPASPPPPRAAAPAAQPLTPENQDEKLREIAQRSDLPAAMRLMALEAGNGPDEQIVELLLEMLESDDRATVKLAIGRSKGLDDPRIQEAMSRLRDHPDEEIRAAARSV